MLSIEKLKEFEPWLISVAKTGSVSLPWIKNPHDIDYVFYVNGKDNKKLVELFKLKPKNECWIVGELNIQGSRPYSYEYYYLQPIFGTIFPDYNIFNYKTEYKASLIKKGYNKALYSGQKFWYHILTGIYLLENDSYTLTDEQIANIRLCHDRAITEELYNFIQQKLTQYNAEIKEAVN